MGYKIQSIPLVDFSATINPTGLTSITVLYAVYRRLSGNLYNIAFAFQGTSNATTMACTLPVVAAYTETFMVRVMDNGSYISTGIMITSAGSATANFYATAATGAFTASGNKRVNTVNVMVTT